MNDSPAQPNVNTDRGQDGHLQTGFVNRCIQRDTPKNSVSGDESHKIDLKSVHDRTILEEVDNILDWFTEPGKEERHLSELAEQIMSLITRSNLEARIDEVNKIHPMFGPYKSTRLAEFQQARDKLDTASN